MCRQINLSANHQKEKVAPQDSSATDATQWITPGKLLTLTKPTRQQHHEAEEDIHAQPFQGLWGYDTGMIQGSDTRQRREPRDTQFTGDQRAPHS